MSFRSLIKVQTFCKEVILLKGFTHKNTVPLFNGRYALLSILCSSFQNGCSEEICEDILRKTLMRAE